MSGPLGSRIPTTDGEWLAVERYTGEPAEPALLFVHATGFCKEVWHPTIGELRRQRSSGEVVAMDQCCHGDSSCRDHPFAWSQWGRDVVTVAATIDAPLVGVGHSSGAAHLILGELEAPGTFAGLVLVEPIVFPPPHERHEPSPLASGALRRRNSFESPADAFRSFRGRGPFAGWTEESLRAYCESGLRLENAHWVLKCRPEDEAEFYRSGSDHDAWDRLDQIQCPVVLVAGANSDTHPPSLVAALAERLAPTETVVVAGASHFVPMERPDRIADIIATLVEVAGEYRHSPT